MAADALECAVAISLPGFGLAAHWPVGLPAESLAAVAEHAGSMCAGLEPEPPALIVHQAPVRLGTDVVGIVAALGQAGSEPSAWLEATAAAAAVIALMHDSGDGDPGSARRAFLEMLELHDPADTEAVLARARRLGFDFSQGAVGFSVQLRNGDTDVATIGARLPEALVARVGADRLLGLLPLTGLDPAITPEQPLRSALAGFELAHSMPRRDPRGLRAALLEAAVLIELLADPVALLPSHEETYRLLIGVLVRDPEEVARLRIRTIAELERYDELHDTELLATLEAFLSHHGSTTETAEAMSLHRHTVGYRLTRVQEVSGLSPYESDGRERLGLGLKAHRIMLAEARRAERRGAGG